MFHRFITKLFSRFWVRIVKMVFEKRLRMRIFTISALNLGYGPKFTRSFPAVVLYFTFFSKKFIKMEFFCLFLVIVLFFDQSTSPVQSTKKVQYCSTPYL